MRAETGPLKFGDDWTGLFLRGDSAFGYALALEIAIEALARDPGRKDGGLTAVQLRALLRLLRSSWEGVAQPQRLQPFAECVIAQSPPSVGGGTD